MGKVLFNKMNAIVSAFPTALVILKPDDPNFTVEEVNNAFLKLTGMDRQDLILKPFFKTVNGFALDSDQESLSDLSFIVRKAIAKRDLIKTDIIEFERSLNQSSGSTILYLQFKCSPVINESGTLDSVLLVVEDLTEILPSLEKRSKTKKVKTRKELHNLNDNLAAQAAVSQAQYESASQELDDFVYSVSHDLRAPLRRIDGFSQELLNEYVDKLDETGAHYLKRIRQGAQDMGQLIDDLLKLSRISRKSVDRDEIDLDKMAKEVFNELMELEPERVVTLQIDENLNTHADKGLIKAMLGNILSNALKFTSKNEAAEIEVGSKILDGDQVFYVSDNGVGFDPAYSHKLFKAFSRLHSHNEFSGTGIGLATVKRIMTLHGGTIWAESPEGEGATFYFKF